MQTELYTQTGWSSIRSPIKWYWFELNINATNDSPFNVLFELLGSTVTTSASTGHQGNDEQYQYKSSSNNPSNKSLVGEDLSNIHSDHMDLFPVVVLQVKVVLPRVSLGSSSDLQRRDVAVFSDGRDLLRDWELLMLGVAVEDHVMLGAPQLPPEDGGGVGTELDTDHGVRPLHYEHLRPLLLEPGRAGDVEVDELALDNHLLALDIVCCPALVVPLVPVTHTRNYQIFLMAHNTVAGLGVTDPGEGGKWAPACFTCQLNFAPHQGGEICGGTHGCNYRSIWTNNKNIRKGTKLRRAIRHSKYKTVFWNMTRPLLLPKAKRETFQIVSHNFCWFSQR